MLPLGGISPTADTCLCLCLLPYTLGGERGHEEGLTCKTGLELICRAHCRCHAIVCVRGVLTAARLSFEASAVIWFGNCTG